MNELNKSRKKRRKVKKDCDLIKAYEFWSKNFLRKRKYWMKKKKKERKRCESKKCVTDGENEEKIISKHPEKEVGKRSMKRETRKE